MSSSTRWAPLFSGLPPAAVEFVPGSKPDRGSTSPRTVGPSVGPGAWECSKTNSDRQLQLPVYSAAVCFIRVSSTPISFTFLPVTPSRASLRPHFSSFVSIFPTSTFFFLCLRQSSRHRVRTCIASPNPTDCMKTSWVLIFPLLAEAGPFVGENQSSGRFVSTNAAQN